MFDVMALENLIKAAADDPALAELFGGAEQVQAVRKKQDLNAEARLRVAQAVLNVFNSEDGRTVFEYLANSYIRRFENFAGTAPADVAIQLYAEAGGKRAVVEDLFGLVKLAQNPPAKQEA